MTTRDGFAFEYLCSEGHSCGAPYELKACPAYRLGKPCKGTLRRVGKGSRRRQTGPVQSVTLLYLA